MKAGGRPRRPGGIVEASLACKATFAGTTLTISPGKADSFPVYTPGAAAACKDLPYVGTHTVQLRN